MNKIILPFMLVIGVYVHAQTTIDSATQSQINHYYKLALQYKDGKEGTAIDYDKAYGYFTKAAKLGDAQSTYAIAYMHYKGLGCEQDYTKAAKLFAQGAAQNRDNSLYFYGLCCRNGYGVEKNEDSAKYYLQKSADLGYKIAMMELATPTAENSNDSAAQVLLQQINNAAISNKNVINEFNKIQPHLPSAEIIRGDYTGWLIQYDWSGTHMVATKKLQLHLNAGKRNVSGEWIEETDTAKIEATIASDNLLFEKTQYARKDHYSLTKGITYNFQEAKLNVVQQGDSVFLAGNVEMFSPVRGEPSKPIFVALSRSGLKAQDSIFFSQMHLTAYPNPFGSTLNVQVYLPKSANVSVQLYNMSGALLYNKEAGVLEEGNYTLPIYNISLVQGVYILKLNYNSQSRTIKVIKQ